MYTWGDAPIGDGSNIPRKNPVSVLQNVIQCVFPRIALTSAGKLYHVDVGNTFKYEVFASNVYLLYNSFWFNNNYYTYAKMVYGYYSNDGLVYQMKDFTGSFSLFLRDVALPQIKED